MNIYPVLFMLALIVLLVALLFALGRIGRSPSGRAPYQPPEIGGGEVVSSCSGGHASRNRPYWGTDQRVVHPAPPTHVPYGPPPPPPPGPRIEKDQPIAVPNWPVKVGKKRA